MTITAKIIADSISAQGVRLTTMLLKYPRFIHAEAKTHRIMSIGGEEYVALTQDEGFMSDKNLSRNASSSRAIPIEKMIQAVLDDPAMPIHWGANQKGMQAAQELSIEGQRQAKRGWMEAMMDAVENARMLDSLGLHKQIVNRVLEPFSHITVVVTATEWNNFLHLRDHKDAQPEIAELARQVKSELDNSIPVRLGMGHWHLPFVDVDVEYAVVERLCQVGRITRDMPKPAEVYDILIKMSAARCARTSYLTHDKKNPTIDEDVALYERLVGGSPLHASPTEHQATPDEKVHPDWPMQWNYPELHGNLTGWKQHRKYLNGENVTTR